MVRIIEDKVAEDPDIFSQENAASLFRRALPAAWRGHIVSLYTSIRFSGFWRTENDLSAMGKIVHTSPSPVLRVTDGGSGAYTF